MANPRLLDLFCGAGGASVGYARAGFDVVGVDIKPQPHYPFEFIRADALVLLDAMLAGPTEGPFGLPWSAIHASPPCQAFTTMSVKHRGRGGEADQHLNLLSPTRSHLLRVSKPWVIENVPGARRYMHPTLSLHGGMFGLGVDRARLFESNVLMFQPAGSERTVNAVGVYGKSPDGRLLWKRIDGSEQHAAASLKEAQKAMGIDWMDWPELKEAIPPAYTEFIGRQLLQVVERAA